MNEVMKERIELEKVLCVYSVKRKFSYMGTWFFPGDKFIIDNEEKMIMHFYAEENTVLVIKHSIVNNNQYKNYFESSEYVDITDTTGI